MIANTRKTVATSDGSRLIAGWRNVSAAVSLQLHDSPPLKADSDI
jgi:hypothetical protein